MVGGSGTHSRTCFPRGGRWHAGNKDGAVRRLDRLMRDAVDSIPACPGEQGLRELILAYGQRFLPEGLARAAA